MAKLLRKLKTWVTGGMDWYDEEAYSFPKSMEEFGYKFNEAGELRSIDANEAYVFRMKDSHSYNQQRYEALGEIVTDYIYECMEQEFSLERVYLPIDGTSEEPQSFIFVSKDVLASSKLLVLIHGSGAVRAGQWSRKLIINNNIDIGSQLPYIRQGIMEGYGIIVLNTNLNTVKKGHDEVPIKNNENPERHGEYVFDMFVSKSVATCIAVVAHSYGGIVTKELVKGHLDFFKEKVFALAFTDSVHSFRHMSMLDNQDETRRFFRERGCNFAASYSEKNYPLNEGNEECPAVSAGTDKHEWTSHKCFDILFDFLSERLIAWVNDRGLQNVPVAHEILYEGGRAIDTEETKKGYGKSGDTDETKKGNWKAGDVEETQKGDQKAGDVEETQKGDQKAGDIEEIWKEDGISEVTDETQQGDQKAGDIEETWMEHGKSGDTHETKKGNWEAGDIEETQKGDQKAGDIEETWKKDVTSGDTNETKKENWKASVIEETQKGEQKAGDFEETWKEDGISGDIVETQQGYQKADDIEETQKGYQKAGNIEETCPNKIGWKEDGKSGDTNESQKGDQKAVDIEETWKEDGKSCVIVETRKQDQKAGDMNEAQKGHIEEAQKEDWKSCDTEETWKRVGKSNDIEENQKGDGRWDTRKDVKIGDIMKPREGEWKTGDIEETCKGDGKAGDIGETWNGNGKAGQIEEN